MLHKIWWIARDGASRGLRYARPETKRKNAQHAVPASKAASPIHRVSTRRYHRCKPLATSTSIPTASASIARLQRRVHSQSRVCDGAPICGHKEFRTDLAFAYQIEQADLRERIEADGNGREQHRQRHFTQSVEHHDHARRRRCVRSRSSARGSFTACRQLGLARDGVSAACERFTANGGLGGKSTAHDIAQQKNVPVGQAVVDIEPLLAACHETSAMQQLEML